MPNLSGPPFTPPVVWLLGKVQSGKSSIVRTLTGLSDIEIGSGFKATTKVAHIFDYPATSPVIRFLDTRGLGEAKYESTADVQTGSHQSDLVLVVMKALDHQQSSVLDALRAARYRRPDIPVVVAQTTLHEAYASGAAHLLPYPFGGDPGLWTSALPHDLTRSLAAQRESLGSIPMASTVAFVPIDFTLRDDGYQPQDYGMPALVAALEAAAPASLVTSIRAALQVANAGLAAGANPQILQYATAAAAADLVPVAGAVAVPGIQAAMLRSLATVYGVSWDRRTTAQFAACFGTGTVTRMLSMFGIRELVKLVPVYGQTAGAAAAAAASFATTYAMGKAATYFLGQRRLGDADTSGVQKAYADALRQAFIMHRPEGAPWGTTGGRKP
jgi:uncharacterized protein (DUF697 family)